MTTLDGRKDSGRIDLFQNTRDFNDTLIKGFT